MFTIGHWQAKIGDPSLMGWLTVASYYFCAALSFACFLKARRRRETANARLRLAMTGVVLGLGFAKHFNLPGVATEIGRMIANHIGGYEWRRWAQGFVLLFAGVVLVFLIRWSVRHRASARAWQCCAPEMICLCYLCTLVILRAISFHHAGALLAMEVSGVRVNWIVELTGIYSLAVILLVRLFARNERTDFVR